MPTYNSIRSIQFLLYFIVIITTGCSEKVKTHAFVNELPETINQVSLPSPTKNLPVNKENSSVQSTTKPLTTTHDTVWSRLISLYALPEIENERIDAQVQKYLKHPEFLVSVQQRAEPYLYFILDEIESKQIPGELALLPIVESAFKPNALSKSNASGLWQFMPATGRYFGLKQNWWYDGRRDVYTSTKAATSYLKQLSEQFDDNWLLALAAYNAGKGTISKAINKNEDNNLDTDYWSLPLHKETMAYVPRLLAIAKIFANADQYNIPLQQIPNEPYFTVVNIDSQLDLTIATEMAQIPLIDFLILNPAFKKGVTDPDGPFHLLIHKDKADLFKQTLAHTLEKDKIKWTRHKIIKGENLGSIAMKYNTSVNALRQSNQLANSNIRAGKLLLIPTSLEKSENQLYIVKKGDTFWDIARQFDVSSKDIAHWNNLSLAKALQPGQRLVIKEG
ncbi:MAG: transglycosylase SLT domain-containing protein [Methylococcaceae bacterium]